MVEKSGLGDPRHAVGLTIRIADYRNKPLRMVAAELISAIRNARNPTRAGGSDL